MKIIDPLPRPLDSPALVTIPTRDGVMLSARLWLPVLAPGERVPAIVDCHPYCVTDSSAIGNSRVYPYYAAHGYGCLRVDLRGSGNSEGILRDEYLAQEQDDGVDVINWCATQEWCTGAVGWTGISWGGYLTSIVSGVDSRFRFAAPVYGCGFLGEDSAWLKDFANLGPQRAQHWLDLWDPSQYLGRTKMPTLWVNGTNDFAYPPPSWRKSYRLTKGPRTLAYRVRVHAKTNSHLR